MSTNMRNIAKFGPTAQLIKKAMAAKGFTQITLAQHFPNPKAAGSNINIWLSAKGNPGPKYRNKLAALLDLRPEQLMGASPPSTALVPIPPQPKEGKQNKTPDKEPLFTITISVDGTIVITKGNVR